MEKTKVTIEMVDEMVSALSDEQKQVLKDAIRFGCWGDADYTFLNSPNAVGNENYETVLMTGYCTNDAKQGGHFEGRKISGLFRGIYVKMCPECHNQVGYVISHCRDWWGDGSGDMLFIRDGWDAAFEEWARN